jgi:hypothetical protein
MKTLRPTRKMTTFRLNTVIIAHAIGVHPFSAHPSVRGFRPTLGRALRCAPGRGNLALKPVCQALALVLSLGTLSASALQSTNTHSAPAQAKAWTPNSASSPSHLTPAAPVASRIPASSTEDIRDIRQPRHLPTPLTWVAVAAGVMLFLGVAFAVWRWLRHSNRLPLTPCEAALRQLEEARRLMDPEHAREYSFAASQIIRSYIEAQFHVHAHRLTTEEFLRDLVEVRETMLAFHRVLLGDFLQHCDLAKFAGWRYSQPALDEMQATAITFVRQSAATQSRANVPSAPAAEAQTATPSQEAAPVLNRPVLAANPQP